MSISKNVPIAAAIFSRSPPGQVGETGKSCKELAEKELYEKKIAADEGLSLYQRRNKAYAMRVSRAPEIYKDQEYQA